MNVRDYFRLAGLNQGLSPKEIAARLNLPPATLAAILSGAALPGDDIMVIIGGMAGAPHQLVLRDLAEWRARPRRSRRRLSLLSLALRLSPAPVALADGD